MLSGRAWKTVLYLEVCGKYRDGEPLWEVITRPGSTVAAWLHDKHRWELRSCGVGPATSSSCVTL